MLTLAKAIDKTCLIGLTYFNTEGEMLKQSLLAGKVSAYDSETGITITLFEQGKQSDNSKSLLDADNSQSQAKRFIIPIDLSCWFHAPSGIFHTSVDGVTVSNPDYLVTWDIYQCSSRENDEQMQWWQWKPNVERPTVGV
ncbi:hypothetical protein [Shewanella sp. UCD-KL12]|uniref:hypothetical protein n=1 Tax=Shewanella sp. UCD-KL12 TaxID=1917163 RepID=UPI00097083EC|nr:hypothetical protein [Shewanella sp. UCD-KL12]